MDNKPNLGALYQLNLCKRALTQQQYKTLRGQILAGEAEAAFRGLDKIMKRRRAHRDNTARQSPGHSSGQQPKDKKLEK